MRKIRGKERGNLKRVIEMQIKIYDDVNGSTTKKGSL